MGGGEMLLSFLRTTLRRWDSWANGLLQNDRANLWTPRNFEGILSVMPTKSAERLKQSRIACVQALRNYMREADKTCSLLNSIRAFPVPFEKRLAILDQRLRENAAHERYQLAREQLFRLAKWNGSPASRVVER
jgi:hypothetical protein